MKKFKFGKALVESKIAPESTKVLWVDVDEANGKIATIKEFINGSWVSILDNDAADTQAQKAVTITTNGSTNVTPDSAYKAMKKVVVTTNVLAEDSTYTTLKYFGGELTLDTDSAYTPAIDTPITTGSDKHYPVKIKIGTTMYEEWGTINSTYVTEGETVTPKQEVKFVNSSTVATFERTYSNDAWSAWAVPQA